MKITKLIIRRKKEHNFIWHPEYQHAAIFMELTILATKLPSRLASTPFSLTLPITSVQRDGVRKYKNQFSRLVKNVCNFTLHFKIAKLLYIYSTISYGSPRDGVLRKPGRDTLG